MKASESGESLKEKIQISLNRVIEFLEIMKGDYLDENELENIGQIHFETVKKFPKEWGTIEVEAEVLFLNNVIGIPFDKINDGGRYSILGVDVYSDDIIRKFWNNPHEITLDELEKVFYPFIQADLRNKLKRELSPMETARIREVVLPPLFNLYKENKIKMVDIFHYAELRALELLDVDTVKKESDSDLSAQSSLNK